MSRVLHRLRPGLIGLIAVLALTWAAASLTAQQPPAAEPVSPTQRDFDAAKALYQDGKWAEALAAFLKFEKDHQFSTLAPEAIHYEGWCLANLKRLPEAINTFLRLEKSFPLAAIVPNALLKKAECYRELKDFPKALATYQDFFQRFPKHALTPQAMLSEAATLYKQYTFAREKKEAGDPKLLVQAKQLAQTVRTQFAGDTSAKLDALSLLGQLLNEEKNFDQARAVYEELKSMRNNPRATDALFMEAESMYEAKRFEDAIGYYQQVKSKASLIENLQADIDQLRARIPRELDNRGLLQSNIESLRLLQTQIAAGGDLRASALFRIANCYSSLGRPEEASLVYRHFLRLFPADKLAPQAQFGLIQALTERGQPKLAEEESEKFRKQHPEGGGDLMVYALFLQAKGQFDTGQFKDSQRLFEKFATETKEPEMKQTAEFYVAACAYAQEQFAAARDAFAKFIEKNPAGKLVPDALFRLGRSYFELSQRALEDPPARQTFLQGAITAFEDLRAKHPKPELLPDVTFQLGYLYSYLGEIDKAAFEKANVPKAKFDTANFDKAVAAFRDFVKGWPQDPKAPEAAYQVALVLLTAGKLTDAIEADKFLLEHYGDNKLACFAAFDIGKAYAMASKSAEMIKALRAYVERCPSHPQVGTALFAIASDEEGHGKLEDAIADYHKLVAVATSADASAELINIAVVAQSHVANILEGQAKFAEAVADCEDFLGKFSASPVAVRAVIDQLTTLYRNAKKFTEAYEKLAALAAKYQQNSSIRVALTTKVVELALLQKDFQRAYATALRLLADPEKDQLPGATYLAIGNTMLKTEHVDQARAAFDKVISLYSADQRLLPPALVGIGQAYLGLKKLDEAEAAFRKMLSIAPENAGVLDAKMGLADIDLAKGSQLETAGNKAEAKTRLKEAVDFNSFVMANGKGEVAGKAALALGNFFLSHEKDCKTALPYLLRVMFLAGGPVAEEATFRVAEANECLSTTLPGKPEQEAARETARNGYKSYLKRYPEGKFVAEAQKQLAALPAPAPQP